MKIKQWLWNNKEGAIVGGLIGALPLLFYLLKLSMFDDYTYLMFLYIIPMWFIQLLGITNIFITGMIIFILYAFIGAFIDSLWRKNK